MTSSLHRWAPAWVILLLLTQHSGLFLEMVQTWWTEDTLNQGLIITPIVLWLFLTGKPQVNRVNPWYPGLLLFLLTNGLIVIGQLTHTDAVAEIGLISSLLLIPAILYGLDFVKAFWFTFAFSVFAMPVWSPLTPYAQLLSTWATVFFMGFSGIPIFAEGFSIEIPNGVFVVEEGCSGMRYLVSALVIGSLYVHLSDGARLVKLGMFALLVGLSVLGNWVRILVIIAVGHLYGMDHPIVNDHVTLGWVIFAVALFLWFLLGQKVLRKKSRPDPVNIPFRHRLSFAQTGSVLLVLAAISLLIPQISSRIFSDPDYRPVNINNLTPVGWQPAATPDELEPDYNGSQKLHIRPNNTLDTYLLIYQQQQPGAELINVTNSNFNPQRWELLSRTRFNLQLEDQPFIALEEIIKGRDQTRRILWSWFEYGDHRSAQPLTGKLLELRGQALGRNGTAAVIWSLPVGDDISLTRKQLTDQVKIHWPELADRLERVLAP